MENLSNIQYWEVLMKKNFPSLTLIGIENGLVNSVGRIRDIINNDTFTYSYGVCKGMVNLDPSEGIYYGFGVIFDGMYKGFNFGSPAILATPYEVEFFAEKGGIFFGGAFEYGGSGCSMEYIIFRFK